MSDEVRKKSPTITGRKISEILSVSQRTIKRDLSYLQKKGYLRHKGKDNNGVWAHVKGNGYSKKEARE